MNYRKVGKDEEYQFGDRVAGANAAALNLNNQRPQDSARKSDKELNLSEAHDFINN